MAERLMVAVGAAGADEPEQEVTAFGSLTVRSPLNGSPVVQFAMPGRSPAALLSSGLATDVWVYKNGLLWRRMRMLPIAQEWDEDGGDLASVNATGYRGLVEARHIISGPPVFNNVEQGEIVWGLIQHTQGQPGGDLGITAGDINTGTPRDRTEYQIGANIGTLLNNLSGVIGGPWWGIDANKVLTVRRYDAFPVRANEPIVHGMNARRVQRRPGARFANVGGAVGSREQTEVEWRLDPGVETDPRGRWEVIDTSHGDVTVQARVGEYADAALADRIEPPYNWNIELDPTWYYEGGSDYEPGDFVPIVVPASVVDEVSEPRVDVMAQVTEVRTGIDENGKYVVNLAAVEVREVEE